MSWGTTLTEQAGMFDIDGMGKSLEQYPDLIAALRGHATQGT